MGWLGWTPEVALATDAAIVSDALGGRSDLLAMVFGGGKSDKDDKGKKKGGGKVKAKDFTAFRDRVNRGKKGGK